MWENYRYIGEVSENGQAVYAYCSTAQPNKTKFLCFVGLYEDINEWGQPKKCLRSIHCEIDKSRDVKIANWLRKQIEKYENMIK